MKGIPLANQAPREQAAHPGHPVILSLPSLLSPFDTLTIDHGHDFTTVLKNKKTYRRLFGMIFFEASQSMVVAALQHLATRKILKNRKNTKANSFFISRNINLAAKTPQKGGVFRVSTKLA
jgi:hypothetical protein